MFSHYLKSSFIIRIHICWCLVGVGFVSSADAGTCLGYFDLQGNIMKIRKVYDAFLAEFPLCYGYWKKYADHEARIGSMDKVVEVYERAVQGVTYSVDMWLHYCVFAISTYGDPETIRR